MIYRGHQIMEKCVIWTIKSSKHSGKPYFVIRNEETKKYVTSPGKGGTQVGFKTEQAAKNRVDRILDKGY